MSRGKYSPNLPPKDSYEFNCYGQPPAPWSQEVADSGVKFDEKTMFADHDDEGFDRYGYSSFNEAGEFVGNGQGVDRNGYTETDYLFMSDDEFSNFW